MLIDAKKKGCKNAPSPISPSMVTEMKEMASLLSPFILATNQLQSDKVTSSLAIGTILCLYKGEFQTELLYCLRVFA